MAYHTTQRIKVRFKESQLQKVEQAYGNARFAYNWALGICASRYDMWLRDKTQPRPYIHFEELNKLWTETKPAFASLSCRASQTRAIQNAATAYQQFFDELKLPRHKRIHALPHMHKKRGHQSCYFTNYKVHIDGRYIYIPLIGWALMTEPIRFDGKLMSYTLKREYGENYLYMRFECEGERPHGSPIPGTAVAIDVGLTTPAIAVDNNGGLFRLEMPDTIVALNKRIKAEQAIASRRKKGSNRWKKQNQRIKKLMQRRENIRKDAVNKFTNDLTKSHEIVVTEQLNCAAMRKGATKILRKGLAFSCMSELIAECAYKAHKYVPIDRYFASSKMCSSCGHIDDSLTLKDRMYNCNFCGLSIDRDINAAINLLHAGMGSP